MEQNPSLPARWKDSLSGALEHPLHRLRIGYAAWLFGIFCYFLPAATWNPVSRFDLTRSVVERSSFAIDPYVDNTGDRAHRGEHWYSDKAPLAALLAVPAYQAYHWMERSRGKAPAYQVVAKAGEAPQRVTVNRSFQRALYVCSLSTAALAGVGVGLALFELLRRRLSIPTALAGSAAAVLATPLFPYATSFYGHAVAAGFLTIAVALLDTWGAGAPSSTLELPSRRRALLAGLCLGTSIGCEYLSFVPAAALSLVFALGFVLSSRDRGRALQRCASELLVPMGVGALGPVLIIAGYHWACFGAPWRTGYSFVVDPKFAAGHASGLLGIRLPSAAALWGLSFGRLRGLFYIAPLALALLVGLVARARSRDRAALAGACAFVALLLVNSSYYMWWGGAAAGPRHLVPVLGLLALGVPWLWQRAWLRSVCGALALVSLFNMIAIAAVGLEAPEHGDILRDFIYERLAAGKLSALSGASNLGIEFGVVRGGSLGPLLVWLLVGARMLYRQTRELPAEAEGAGPAPTADELSPAAPPADAASSITG
ncbi:MAG TPA: hypothetical protein VFS67_29305 [Polyangiaceae bacterium]|nr:hypothetical protein [Polyangiaceae bacterium]